MKLLINLLNLYDLYRTINQCKSFVCMSLVLLQWPYGQRHLFSGMEFWCTYNCLLYYTYTKKKALKNIA